MNLRKIKRITSYNRQFRITSKNNEQTSATPFYYFHHSFLQQKLNISTTKVMMSSSLDVVRSVKLGILVPTNLVGNILVVMVVMRSKKSLKTPMNYLLVNLAFADIMVAVFMVTDQLFFHVVLHPEGVAGDYLCKLVTGKILTWVGSVASVCTLLSIAFER